MANNKKIKELLLQVIGLLDEPDRDFLSYDEAQEKADDVHWYEKGVYKYKIEGKWYEINLNKYKLPEIGKIYKRIDNGDEVYIEDIIEDKVSLYYPNDGRNATYYTYKIDLFLDLFKEASSEINKNIEKL